MLVKEQLVLMSRYNTWMNHRLYETVRALTPAEFTQDRKAFFGSISVSPELKRNDQYIKTAETAASPISKIALYGGGGLVLLLIGYFIYRKKTETAIS